MKNLLIALGIAALLVIGYLKLTARDEQVVQEQKQQRELIITAKEQQMMKESKQMSQQMQDDVTRRMAPVDRKGE